MNRPKDILGKVFQNRIVQHILFWSVSYYYLIHSFSITDNIEKIDFIYTGVFHLTIITGVYINLYILIPRLLSRKRYLLYGLLFTILLAVMAQLNIFIFDYAIDYFLPDYFFVSNYSFLELVQFGFVYLSVTTLLKLSKAWFRLVESENHLVRLEKEKASSELLFLKTQINPHFLFNSLNNIYSLALKKDPMTPDILLKLAGVMRYMIHESNEDFVPLEKEINYIGNYIELQKLRTRDNSSIVFEVTGDIKAQRVAPLIFIVFIENSFTHGVNTVIANAFVHIKMDVKYDSLSLTVTNSKNIAAAEKEGTGGLGLENVKRRLALLYPGKHRLAVEETDDKYRIELNLILHSQI